MINFYDLIDMFIKSKFKMIQKWVQYFIFIIKLIIKTITYVNSNQIHVIYINEKITCSVSNFTITVFYFLFLTCLFEIVYNK